MENTPSSLRKLIWTRQQAKTVLLLVCAYILLIVTGLLFKFLSI